MTQSQSTTKVKTRQQIASEYGYSYSTLWRRLNKHGLDLSSGLISRRWQKMIYETLGYPDGISPNDYDDVMKS